MRFFDRTPLFLAATVKAAVVVRDNADYDNGNYYPNPDASAEYAVVAAIRGTAFRSARIAGIAHIPHCNSPPHYMFWQPQSLLQPLSQQLSSLFIKRRITKMMNQRIVLLSLLQQPLFLPNKPNIVMPPF